MPIPISPKPLQGLLGSATASFYRLNKFGLPIQLITDLNPLPSANRVVFDMIDSESDPENYSVTQNALQDLSNASTNVHRELDVFTIVGTLVSTLSLGLIGQVGIGNLPGQSSPFRPDLQALANLRTLARAREPIMVVTPRRTMPLAFIQNITPTWTPDLGENTQVSVTLVEARIVDPFTAGSLIPDVAASHTGNNAANAAGGQSGTPINAGNVAGPPAPGAAPSVQAITRIPA